MISKTFQNFQLQGIKNIEKFGKFQKKQLSLEYIVIKFSNL